MLQINDVYGTSPTTARFKLVRVYGEVDFASARRLREYLEDAWAANADGLIVSLEACTYFDSRGLLALVQLHRAIGGRLKLVIPQGTRAHRIFALTGFDRVLNIYSALSQAVER